MKLLQDNIEAIKELIELNIEPLLDEGGDVLGLLEDALIAMCDIVDASFAHIQELKMEEE